ncbi:DUF397 domain-containing protein [Streptomyces rimosus]|uniref:DUF397 domain-containing protein n=1 Tax=Streptomyces rimosus TaxID=1927 RepID=UPI00099CE504|nr:DUF397 domain-containing protein [Streptomyces rimosus]
MSQLAWQKSSFSEGGADTCVEMALDPAGATHLRESAAPAATVIAGCAAVRCFVRVVKAGAFDGP